jgi:hypothetical protein
MAQRKRKKRAAIFTIIPCYYTLSEPKKIKIKRTQLKSEISCFADNLSK